MNAAEMDAFAAVLGPTIRDFIASALTPMARVVADLQAEVAALKARSASVVQSAGIAEVMRNAEREVVFVLTNGETRNIGRVDGMDGRSVADEDMRVAVAREVDARMAALEPKDPDPVAIEALVDAKVERAIAALPPALPGKDAEPPEPELLRGMIVAELATMPKPEDGKSADPAEVAEILRSQIEAPLVQCVADAIAGMPALTQPKDGADGRDADPAEVATLLKADMEPVVRALVTEAFAALPPARDGQDADPAETQRMIAAEVTRQMEAAPKPRDGIDGKDGRDGADGKDGENGEAGPAGRDGVDGKDGQAGVDGAPGEPGLVGPQGPAGEAGMPGEHGKSGADGINGRDGIGLTGAIINRDGNLVVTLSDGSMRELGAVVGRDADMDALAAVIMAEIAKMPKPRDGVDGLGLDDLSIEFDGERTITLRFVRGDLVREKAITFPVPIHRGLWKEGAYVVGDMVIRGGSTWCCRQDTTGMPNASPDWILTAKRGADGKNTETVKILPATVKLPDDKSKT